MRELRRIFFALVASTLLVSCGFTVGYTLSGASIPPDAKSFSVAYFPNNATMVSPILSSEMTDALKEIFLRRTKLYEVSEAGDFAFEGEITNYTSTTASVTAGSESDYSALNRLTITVRVRFTNAIDVASSFSKNYSAFQDYDSSVLLTEIESELIPVIVEEIVTDIFQDAASNW
ncbi:MAG: LptE family protein [Rikenellaceae bacterium]